MMTYRSDARRVMVKRAAREKSGAIGVILIACVACTWSLAAQEPGPRRTVAVRLVETARSGATGSGVAETRHTLPLGRSFESALYVGEVGGRGFGVGTGSEGWRNFSVLVHSWRVVVRLDAIEGDSSTLDVTWTRSDSGDPFAAPGVVDHRSITLPLGRRHVLDYRDLSAGDSDTANVLLEIETPLDEAAGTGPVARLTGGDSGDAPREVLLYELWLVHELGNGQRITRRLDISGQEGLMAQFRFQPIGFPLDAADQPGALDGPVKVVLEGGVMGRLKADGSLEMTLLSRRLIRCSRGLTAQEGGVKLFTAQPGEPIAVDLPWAFGYCQLGPDVVAPVSPRAGVIVDGRRRRVEFKDFFAGERTSILVTARVRQP